MDSLITKLYKSPKTVFTTKDLALIWGKTDRKTLKAGVAYYEKRGVLVRLSRGIFAKDRNYNPKELATSIYAPSYISFETVLREAGVIFQHYDTLFVAGPWPKIRNINGRAIVFRKLKDSVLYNPAGIIHQENYSIATPERAFLDMIYLFPQYYFDNLRGLDWKKCLELVKLYRNRQLEKRVNKYYKQYAQ